MLIAMMLAASTTAPTCPADRAQEIVGARYDEHARKAADAIAGKGRVRWIMPGSAVTQDWSPQRLNLEVGDDGMVLKAWCG